MISVTFKITVVRAKKIHDICSEFCRLTSERNFERDVAGRQASPFLCLHLFASQPPLSPFHPTPSPSSFSPLSAFPQYHPGFYAAHTPLD